MRRLLFSPVLVTIAVLVAACGGGANANLPSNANRNAQSATASATPLTSAPSDVDAPPLASAHGGASGNRPAPSLAAGNSSENPSVDTSELDAKIERTEAKAKEKNADAADKRAAGEAYFERGYVYYSAQNPKLYKFALGDFRRSLRYQPDNGDAKAIIEQIESIYRSMGRPVPTNGLEN